MRKILLILSLLLLPSPAIAEDAPTPHYAIALHGSPKYPADFKHVDYANPDAPKGGILRQAALGSFDSLNPFIVKGTPAAGLAENFIRSGLIYESLMMNGWDEPFTMYGVLAETIEIPEDRSWVAFNLRPEAKWADGKPLTAEDVVWTFNTLKEKGQPFFKAYYGDVKEAIAESPSRVRFNFSVVGNAELPLIVSEMAILPKHFWEGKKFDESTLEKPLGSGPYTVGTIDPGRSIEYKRRNDWWGKDLPMFKGFYNFDTLRYDYFLDDNVALESFLGNDYDVRTEATAKLWKNSYNTPALKDGRLIKEEIENARPAGLQGFIYNIRRPVFQDPVVRDALAYAFDFEWSNKQFAFGAYTRTDSYFENSELASSGLPAPEELALLEPYRGKIPGEVFTKTYAPPKNDGTGNNRENLRTAAQMLDAAGWKIGADGLRAKDGVTLKFEILDSNPQFEKWVLPFLQNLKRIGVEGRYRVIDSAQYQNRMNTFDYDMTIGDFGQSDSPGNEQRDFWGSEKADMQGSRNIVGIKDPVIDDLVTKIIHATSREDLVVKTRALDRILLWRHYSIPMWHYPKWRIAHWNTVERPAKLSGISPLISYTWWAKPAEKKAE
jgi:microcin C transport system substrate-binding protein